MWHNMSLTTRSGLAVTSGEGTGSKGLTFKGHSQERRTILPVAAYAK